MNGVVDCDVAIVGGGPGGTVAAGLLAQRGYRVTLVERQVFPRFKVGESLLPQSCGALQELGLLQELSARFQRKDGATFVCSESGRVCHFAFADAFDKRFDHAFQVQRAPFDELLLKRARELGVKVLQPCHVQAVVMAEERAVGLTTMSEQHGRVAMQARFVVDASGRAALMAGLSGGRQRIEGLDHCSVFAHYRGVQRQSERHAGNIEILMVPRGWLWVIPFRNGLSSVGAVMDRAWFREQREQGNEPGQLLDAALATSPWARRTTVAAERIGVAQTAADFSFAVEKVFGPGWLALGDAAGFIDPLFSSGVHLAIKGAQLAAHAIDRSLQNPDETAAAMANYGDVLARARGLFLGAVQATYRGRLGELLFGDHQRPMIRRMITSMLAGDVFHQPDDLPVWVRAMSKMYNGGIDRMAAALQARTLHGGQEQQR